MKEYETKTKQGKIEKRIYMDSGRFVIYGYEDEGKITKKLRIVLKGNERKSIFIINTGKGRDIAIDADYEDQIYVLKGETPVKVEDLLADSYDRMHERKQIRP